MYETPLLRWYRTLDSVHDADRLRLSGVWHSGCLVSDIQQGSAESLEQQQRAHNGEVIPENQPLMMTGGVLRPYQLEGYMWLRVCCLSFHSAQIGFSSFLWLFESDISKLHLDNFHWDFYFVVTFSWLWSHFKVTVVAGRWRLLHKVLCSWVQSLYDCFIYWCYELLCF